MSFYVFRLFSPIGQLYWVLKHGTFLANRWQEEDVAVFLYHVPDEKRGFFVELGVDKEHDCFVVLRSFSSSGPLEEYTQGMQLLGE